MLRLRLGPKSCTCSHSLIQIPFTYFGLPLWALLRSDTILEPDATGDSLFLSTKADVGRLVVSFMGRDK